MIGKPEISSWLAHRVGLEKSATVPILHSAKALELNQGGRPFVEAFGQKQIKGFVGFVDLVGFTDRVKGKTPSEISVHLRPFLTGIVDLAFDRSALVDKTIGDEVMFLLPDLEEDGGVPAVLLMGQLLGGIHDHQRRLGPEYPLRIGLAYGWMYVDQIQGDGYSEWTTAGEVVHLAKRLHSLDKLSAPSSIAGAFGVLCRESEPLQRFQSILSVVAGFASRMTHEIIGDLDDLKGISKARCAYLLPKAPDNTRSSKTG